MHWFNTLSHLCPVHDQVSLVAKQKYVFHFLSPAVALLHVGAQIRLPTVNQWILIDTPSNEIVGKSFEDRVWSSHLWESD